MQQVSPPTNKATEIAIHILWMTPLIIMTFLAMACNRISASIMDNRPSEGIIEYQITFPDVTDDMITANLLPDRMTYAFTENGFASNFETAGGVFKNRIVADNKKKSLEHQLKVFRKKIRVKMDETDINKMLSQYPNMTVIKTPDIDTIAGFHCKRALIVFEDVNMPEINVYYTNDIRMNTPNWCTQYHEIDGVLMAYEVEEFGIRMRLQAIAVKDLGSPEEMMATEEDYASITKEMMDIELAQLVETFEL